MVYFKRAEFWHRTGQPVDLVDHDLLDETCVDVGEQALQARALQGSSREPRVLVDGWQQHPALRFLARDIRGTGLSLRIEGVELLFETLCLLFIHPRAPNLINLRSASTMPA